MKTIFSGIQPSGSLHIGNYLGAIKQWVEIQNGDLRRENGELKLIFMLADLHTITVPQDPKQLSYNKLDVTAWYIAAGLDPAKTTIFVQSENPDHPYLTWIFDCITPMGWMERMTQFKDKSKTQGERTSVGLFHYPNLMAVDILLYDTDFVPVGEDQTQHLEVTRDIAEKFNKTFGKTFKIPQIMLQKYAARIKSLQNPLVKMSKSTIDPNGTMGLLDSVDEIRNKIMRAVTDSGSEIKSGEDKPALSNLLGMYSAFSGDAIEALEGKYQGKSYAEFKKDLIEVVVSHLEPIQKKHNELMGDTSYLHKVLDQGGETARGISAKKIEAVRNVVGLSRL